MVMDWIIEDNGFSIDRITSNGNKFLLGNGYMGMRGTLEEFNKYRRCILEFNM